MDKEIIIHQAKQVIEWLKTIPTFGKDNMIKVLSSITILENMIENLEKESEE